jgi:ankyrin repeat protein
MQNETAVTNQTTDVLFELFAHYGQGDQETDRLVESTLASGNVNVGARDDQGKTLLLCACESSNLHVVTQVVRMGADVDKPNFNGVTPLHVSCYEQTWSFPICKYLLEHKAFPNAMDSEQCTPLHYAACAGHVVLVAILLLHQAQANKADCRGFTPLDYAVQFGHHKVAELLSAVADTNDEWVEYTDPKTEYPYYMSTVTGETRWLRPDTNSDNTTISKLILKVSVLKRDICLVDGLGYLSSRLS